MFQSSQLDVVFNIFCLISQRIAQKRENAIAKEVNAELDSKPETKKLSRKEKDDR